MYYKSFEVFDSMFNTKFSVAVILLLKNRGAKLLVRA